MKSSDKGISTDPATHSSQRSICENERKKGNKMKTLSLSCRYCITLCTLATTNFHYAKVTMLLNLQTHCSSTDKILPAAFCLLFSRISLCHESQGNLKFPIPVPTPFLNLYVLTFKNFFKSNLPINVVVLNIKIRFFHNPHGSLAKCEPKSRTEGSILNK